MVSEEFSSYTGAIGRGYRCYIFVGLTQSAFAARFGGMQSLQNGILVASCRGFAPATRHKREIWGGAGLPKPHHCVSPDEETTMKRILGTVATLTATLVLAAQTTFAAPAIGNPAFERVWNRQDRPIALHLTGRSWTWGPEPISEAVREQFAEGVEGKRAVQYFDKSRMEINDPTADPNATWYVTNGLLPIELMTGRQQNGLNLFEQRGPAKVTAIGDPNQFPTYADLLPLYQSPGTVNPGDLGKPATGFYNTNKSISGFNDYANDP